MDEKELELFGMTKREKVLFYSLKIENALSSFLTYLLRIKNSRDSRSFSNKSSALSFNQKVNILFDMELLDKDDTWKLQKFMEIRNQFMHNIDASSFGKCFKYISDGKKILNKYQPDSILSNEEKIEKAILSLAIDISNRIIVVTMKVATGELKGGFIKSESPSISENLHLLDNLMNPIK